MRSRATLLFVAAVAAAVSACSGDDFTTDNVQTTGGSAGAGAPATGGAASGSGGASSGSGGTTGGAGGGQPAGSGGGGASGGSAPGGATHTGGSAGEPVTTGGSAGEGTGGATGGAGGSTTPPDFTCTPETSEDDCSEPCAPMLELGWTGLVCGGSTAADGTCVCTANTADAERCDPYTVAEPANELVPCPRWMKCVGTTLGIGASCIPAGTGTTGDHCATSSDCAPGYLCPAYWSDYTDQDTCSRACRPSDPPPDCNCVMHSWPSGGGFAWCE